MKVARFYAPGDIRIEDRTSRPRLRTRSRSGSATARPAAPTSRSSTTATTNIDPPRVMGHEIAGEVVEVGSDVAGWSAGRPASR